MATSKATVQQPKKAAPKKAVVKKAATSKKAVAKKAAPKKASVQKQEPDIVNTLTGGERQGPSDLVIKELSIQKGITFEEAKAELMKSYK